MQRAITALLVVAAIVGAGYTALTHRDRVMQVGRQVKAKFLPCQRPITYSLGSIDTRFGISKTTLINNLKEAEDLWEASSEKNLFEYESTGGDVVVNLVYDYRQEASDKVATLGIQIDKSKASFDALKAKYDALATRIAKEKADLTASVEAYQGRQKAYNDEVAKWNRQGGAPSAAYERLQAEKAALGTEAERIKAVERAINADIDTENAIGTSLNRLASQLNLTVERYNAAGASSGEFEEGAYISEAGAQRIDIYEYGSRQELVRVLSHELGHALGLGHVADESAIMYKVNQGKGLSLKPADTAELSRVCASGLF